jgi:two-component system, NtrC family, sensor histidine kinase HupT/HoxJ
MVAEGGESAQSGRSSQWEEALLVSSHDAALGRLFRGTIHNLNGVLQVATFHGEMEGMMLARAAELFEQARRAESAELAALLAELEALLGGQRDSLGQFTEKINQGRGIMRRVVLTPALTPASGESWNLNDVLRAEIEFLCADSFFKHKVAKQLELAEDQPSLQGNLALFHEIVHRLLENALEAVRGREDAAITATTIANEAGVELVLRDNGPGVAQGDRERIFAPFYTTRPEHLGLGLFLARKLAGELGGEISCLAGAGGVFKLRLPAG